jgi:TonB family protein
MIRLSILFLFLSSFLFSQEKIEPVVDIPAKAKGGKQDVDFVFQSQVIYPEALLKQKKAEDVAIYFTVTSKGEIRDIEFKQSYEEAFKSEAMRLLRYFRFEPAKVGAVPVASTSFLLFKFNPETYKKFTKTRGFMIPKEQAQFDTSFVVYERADKSPEYYKGDDALAEFILSDLQYPDLAVRQNIQGTVVASFIIEPNGTISNLFAEKEFNQLCTDEAFRILRETKWKPGVKDGKLIRYKMKYPIVFNLSNHNKDNATSEQR